LVATSYSQTYLRNAFNNGFLCLECPAFVARLRGLLADQEAQRTVVPGDEVALDLTAGTLTYRDELFRFPPLGLVPQQLVIAGGVENLVAQRLGLATPVD